MKRQHYYGEGMQVIDVIQLFGLGFERGNMIKYIARAGLKDPTKIEEDLKKAETYYDFYKGKHQHLRCKLIGLRYWYVKLFKPKKYAEYRDIFLNTHNPTRKFLISNIVKGDLDDRGVELDCTSFKKMLTCWSIKL
jgi:hypothetical protein